LEHRRAALVTGGAGGIGRAVCAALAAQGCAVAVGDLDLDAAREVASEEGAAVAVAVDVTDAASVARASGTAQAELGPIEILVNAAGWDELHPFLDTDEEFWRRVIAVNFEGCLRVTHALLGGMTERGFGRIVNVASDAARVGSSGEAVYAGAKAAVVAFTKTIARESARHGVTANAVCPGPTDTPMLERMAAAAPDAERLVAALQRAVPMGRLASPEDVAPAIAFLASDEAGFITGQTLSVSGGLTMA
jgi:2-hydroxycyclohexanecarboxyl-CoA dehydrogenase